MIAQALDALPADEVPVEVLDLAEAHLVEAAAHFGPRELRLLGRRVLDVVAPDVAEQQEARRLEDEERRAWRRTSLTSTRLGDGTTRLVLQLPDGVAARLHTYLEAFTSPRHLATGEADRVPVERRRGHAFCALLEALDPSALPIHGGNATTLVVTIDWTNLQNGTGAATLPDGTRISAGEARRLACIAGIIPAVLGSNSEVLDLGTLARLFSAAQKRAMGIGHPTCRAKGCTIPAAWCEAHHFKDPWCHGGRTDLADGKLLCNWHHHRAHDDTYDTEHLPNGDVRFARRTWPPRTTGVDRRDVSPKSVSAPRTDEYRPEELGARATRWNSQVQKGGLRRRRSRGRSTYDGGLDMAEEAWHEARGLSPYIGDQRG